MLTLSRKVLALYVLYIFTLVPSAGWAVSLGDKANLQVVMQQHIERHMVDGAYLSLEPDTGEVVPLYPDTAHTIIMTMGEHFVLCYDFRDQDGKAINVDFYLARNDTSFVVFHTAVEDRMMLKRLMKEGRVSRAD